MEYMAISYLAVTTDNNDNIIYRTIWYDNYEYSNS